MSTVRIWSSWTWESICNSGIENGIHVRYAYEWDGYGAMVGATVAEQIEEFTAAAGKEIREFNPVR